MTEINNTNLLFNLEAEQVVLGKIITNNEYFGKINEILTEDCFYELAHRELFKYIEKTIQRISIVADSITLKSFFDGNEVLKAIGGNKYLSYLLNMSSGMIDIVDYAKIIKDLSVKRELSLLGEEIVVRANKNDQLEDGNKQIEIAERKLFELNNTTSGNKGFKSILKSVNITLDNISNAIKRDSSISGITTGLLDLDGMLGGLQDSDLIILAGRPSMGKTAIAVNIAFSAAQYFKMVEKETGNKKTVGFFSLEMSSEQLTSRILSMQTGLSSEKFRKGDIDEETFTKIKENAEDIADLPFFIDDEPALSISTVRSRVRKLVRQENLSLIFVDYLQLLRGTNESSKSNRVQEINEITQGLKAIAKEFNIPVIALSQLSRSVEQREDKRPLLSDLRESGSIEQDADIVMFIFREAYYEERRKPALESPEKMAIWQQRMEVLRNKSELIIAKHRNGPIGSVELFFDSNTTKFKDYTRF